MLGLVMCTALCNPREFPRDHEFSRDREFSRIGNFPGFGDSPGNIPRTKINFPKWGNYVNNNLKNHPIRTKHVLIKSRYCLKTAFVVTRNTKNPFDTTI